MSRGNVENLNEMIDKNRVMAWNNPSREFELYMEDHRDLILANSEKKYLSIDEMELYRYRPIEYLLSLGYYISAVRYVLWLNQIKSNIEFKDIKYLYLPSESLITNILYPRFRSEASNLKGNESKFFDD